MATMTHDERRQRRKQIAKHVRRTGCTAAEAASHFGLSDCTVREACHEAGVTPNRPRDKSSLDDPSRVAILRNGISRGQTLEEIGERLGVTRERARQLVAKLREMGDVPEPPEMWTITEVAAELGVQFRWVRETAERSGIGTRRGKRQIVFDSHDIEKLRWYLESLKQRTCVVCGASFRSGRQSDCCSDPCRAKNREPKRMLKWGPLRDMPPVEVDEWVPLCEAVRRSGLTQMQVVYLSRVRLVRTRYSPVPTERAYSLWGRETEYALVDVMRAAEVDRRHCG